MHGAVVCTICEGLQDSLQIFFMFNIDVDVCKSWRIQKGWKRNGYLTFSHFFHWKTLKKYRNSEVRVRSSGVWVPKFERVRGYSLEIVHSVTGTSWSISTHLGNGARYVLKFHSVQQQLFSQGIARGEGPDKSKRHSLDGGLVTFRDQWLMRGRNSFDRAPVRLNVGSEKETGQDRRPQLSHAPGINGNDVNRAQMANFGPGLREQPRRKG